MVLTDQRGPVKAHRFTQALFDYGTVLTTQLTCEIGTRVLTTAKPYLHYYVLTVFALAHVCLGTYPMILCEEML